MPKIKLVDEQIDAIMVKELKTAYKLINAAFFKKSDDERDLLDAIETMLKYYMIQNEAEEWIMRQKSK